jgi:Fe-S-cluster-containing hydrogenase component 2
MASPPPPKPNLLEWLLFGFGPGPGGDRRYHAHEDEGGEAGGPSQKVAVKCDMCKGIDGGPACVRACPTGAAIRVGPTEFLEAMTNRQ